MTLLVVVIGAALGAPTRYLVDRAVQARHETLFPYGTLTVNVVASLLLGLLAGAGATLSPTVGVLVGTGFCGALSTYSTFSYETMQLARNRARWTVVANVAASLVVGLGAAAIGWWLGAALA